MTARAQAQVAQLRLGIARSRKLIEQLLALASAQLGALPTPAVSLHEVCRRVLEDLMPLAEQKQLDIGLEGDDARLPIREVELRTVISNLVENAIRHAPVAGHVDLRVEQGVGQVTLSVSDDGPGIDPQEWERVFDPFYRGTGSVGKAPAWGCRLYGPLFSVAQARWTWGTPMRRAARAGGYVCVG